MFLKICMAGMVIILMVLIVLAISVIIECLSDIISLKFKDKKPEEIQSEVKERKKQIKAYLKGWFF